MESLLSYLPTDRRHALAAGMELPRHTTGAALFADISGFTPLTEALVVALGPAQGAEELSSHLNAIYDALIEQVDANRGSVLAFSGDAITCWFDQSGDGGWTTAPERPTSAQRAVACGLAMQSAMRGFGTIAGPGGFEVSVALKVAVTTGPVARFVVGDPAIQMIDALAGETIQRLAAADQQARRDEVVVDAATVAAFLRTRVYRPESLVWLEGYQALLRWRAENQITGVYAVPYDVEVAVGTTKTFPLGRWVHQQRSSHPTIAARCSPHDRTFLARFP